MAGKKVDYEGALSLYEKIGKERPLLPHELERVLYLTQRIKSQQRERRYRERHKEEIKKRERDRRYTKDGKPREAFKKREAAAFKRRYAKNKKEWLEKARQWRKDNPEKYKAQLDRKNAKRQAEKQAKRELKEKNVPKVFVWELVDEETSTVQYILAVAGTAESALEKAGMTGKAVNLIIEIEVSSMEEGKEMASMLLSVVDNTILRSNEITSQETPGSLDRFDKMI